MKIAKKRKTLKFIGSFLVIISAITTPIFICLYIISENNGNLIDNRIASMIPGSLFWLALFFILGVFLIINNKERRNNKKKVAAAILLLSGYVVELAGIMLLLYGNNSSFKSWLINKTMNTVNYQQLANLLYNDKDIKDALGDGPTIKEEYEELITFDEINFNQERYANKYEEEVLKRDSEDQIYKIIKVKGTTQYENYKYEGFIAVIYDPSKVKLATSSGAGLTEESYGETIDTIAKANNALVAINASGWYDPFWTSNGGIPHGVVISNGEFKTDYTRAVGSGGLIGFNEENKLILKYMSKEEAINSGIRDCVDFGPFFIINGKNQYEGKIGGWAFGPRTAIAQRKDGIVLLLVIDGRQEHSYGVDINDMAELLMKYGAYNAANLDGGTSSAMYADGKIINTPHNGSYRMVRQLPNAWIVTE